MVNAQQPLCYILFQLCEVLEKGSQIQRQRTIQWLPRARDGTDYKRYETLSG